MIGAPLSSGVCPRCGREGVLRAHTAARNVYRIVSRSHKRVCPACDYSWHLSSGTFGFKTRRLPHPLLAALLGLLGGLFYAVARDHHPVDRVKTAVVARYVRVYGESNARHHLWRDFGPWLYGSRDAAQADYKAHHP